MRSDFYFMANFCAKIIIFSTGFSCENLAVEDFVMLLMGKKSCRWGSFNVMFGHHFGILVYALLPNLSRFHPPLLTEPLHANHEIFQEI